MVNGLDLAGLGAMLKQRREELGFLKSELARRIDVTPAYITLIEEAQPRAGGRSSRPSERVLQDWTQVLGMSPEETHIAFQRAGRFPPAMFASTRSIDMVVDNGPSAISSRDLRQQARQQEALLAQFRTILDLAVSSPRQAEVQQYLAMTITLVRAWLEREVSS